MPDYYGPMIYCNHPKPERNEELEAKVRILLKNLDPLLDVLWVPNAVWNPKAQDFEGRYCLICNWPQSDGRWAMYQSGEIGAHFDAMGWFCTDMQDPESVPVTVDSIESKVVELLGKCDNTRYPWRSRMKEIMEKNAKVRKAAQQEVLDKTQDIAATLFQAVGRHDATKVERIMREIGDEGN